MSELNFKYPLDLTAVDSVNRILGEAHSIGQGFNRLIVPNEGAFYTDKLIVRDTVNGKVLDPKDHYLPILFYREPSERSGKEVCCAIAIIDRSISGEVEVEYQAVGDVYSNIASLIKDKTSEINLDDFNLIWGDLLGNADIFPGDKDLRELGAIYGFEFVAKALNDLRDAILFGDIDDHDRLKELIEAKYQAAYSKAVAINQEAENHYARKDDPHDVTKAQVGLSRVDNHYTATVADDVEGTSFTLYSTPGGVRESIFVNAINPLTQHIDDDNDPHDVTQTQVGLSNLHDFNIADKATAEAGESTQHYMTPLSLSWAISAQLGDAIDQHIADKGNPHDVTKSQVGLSRINNYPPASRAEAIDGYRLDRMLTVRNAFDIIEASAGPALEDHIGNKNNPHEVTKAQVGLSKVDNVSFADMRGRYIAKGQASTVTVVGPKQILEGETAEWKITNYDIFTNYEISSDFGNVTVNGDTITKLIDGSTPSGDRTLTIKVGNSIRELPILIVGRSVNTPSITSPTEDQRSVSRNTTITSTPFSTNPAGADSHEASHWQLSKVSNFSTLEQNVVVGGNQRTAWNPAELTKNTVYYVRVRYKGAGAGYSPWSRAIMFKSADVVNTQFQTQRQTDITTRWNSQYTTNWNTSRSTSAPAERQTVVGRVYTTNFRTNYNTRWTTSRDTDVPTSRTTRQTLSRSTQWQTTYRVNRTVNRTTSRNTLKNSQGSTIYNYSRTTDIQVTRNTTWNVGHVIDDGTGPSQCLQGYYSGRQFVCFEPGEPVLTYRTTSRNTLKTTQKTTRWSTRKSTTKKVTKNTSWTYSDTTSVQTTETLRRNTTWVTEYTTNYTVKRSTNVDVSRSTYRNTEQVLDTSEVRTTRWTTNFTTGWSASRGTDIDKQRTTEITTRFQTNRNTEV